MTDCPKCGHPVDGLVCPHCDPKPKQRRYYADAVPPPMGWAALYALCKKREPGEEG